jgi:hypothetical protein
MSAVRDKLWLFGMPITERYWEWQKKQGRQGHLMTTLEAAAYLGIPNALYVTQHNFPEPPFDSYARALVSMERVVWSVLGDSRSDRNDVDEVIRLAGEFPNITGGILDDFFKHPKREGPVARFTLEQLDEFRERLHAAPRPLELWVVIYAHQLGMDTDAHLARCDVVTFWNWWGRELHDLEENFARLEQRAGDRPKLLGCYFGDPGGREEGADGVLPVDLMQHQCETALGWLKEGRLAGIILLGNPMCGLGLETVEWTRQWIARVGDDPV